MADPVSAAILGGSALISAFGSISGGRAKRKRQRLIAREKEKQALELQRRTDLELTILEDNLDATVGRGRAQFAGNNIDVGSGAAVQAEMQSFENFTRTALNKQMESTFRQNQLRLEAKIGREVGSDLQTAGNIQAITGLATAGVDIFGGKK